MRVRIFLIAALSFVVLGIGVLLWLRKPAPREIVPLIDVHEQPEVAVEKDLTSFDKGIRTALADKNYGDLETLAAQLRDPDRRFRGGASEIARFYQIAAEVRTLPSGNPCVCTIDPTSFEERKAQLEAWYAAVPDRITASIALAKLWGRAAASARGNAYANDTAPEQWAGMHDAYSHEQKYLDEIDLNRDPVSYQEMISMGMNEGWGQRKLANLYTKAREAFPTYYDFYGQHAWTLQTKWGGRPGELAAYLDSLASPESGMEGQIAYAFAADWLREDYKRPKAPDADVLSFRAINAAYQVREQRFGLTAHDWRSLFYFSLHGGMTVSAIQAFQRMGTGWDDGIWWTRENFDADIAWYKAHIESLEWAKNM